MESLQPSLLAFDLKDYYNLVVKKKTHEVITRQGFFVEVLRTKMRNQHHPIVTVVRFDKSDELIRYGKSKDGTYGCWVHLPSLDLFLRIIGSFDLPEQIQDKRNDNFGY